MGTVESLGECVDRSLSHYFATVSKKTKTGNLGINPHRPQCVSSVTIRCPVYTVGFYGTENCLYIIIKVCKRTIFRPK